MVRITQHLLTKKADHNNGMLISLKDLALHQQGIEKIELINQACRHLTRLYLDNNIIEKIENLHRLKELQYLNLAINNIKTIENLEKCESLRKLDLTLNFIPTSSLHRSITSLIPCYDLKELHLIGNPCTEWHGYREFVIATLEQLKSLDGKEITVEERQHAMKNLPHLIKELSSIASHATESDKESTSSVSSHDCSSMWCPETRRLDQHEWEKLKKVTDDNKKSSSSDDDSLSVVSNNNHFPDVVYNKHGDIMQCNQGNWNFHLEEQQQHHATNNNTNLMLILTIHLESHIDIHTVQLDIHPTYIRMLSSGKLFQIQLPYEIQSSRTIAQRSKATGKLRIVMPVVEDDSIVTSVSVVVIDDSGHDGRSWCCEKKKKTIRLMDASVVCAQMNDNDDRDDDVPDIVQ